MPAEPWRQGSVIRAADHAIPTHGICGPIAAGVDQKREAWNFEYRPWSQARRPPAGRRKGAAIRYAHPRARRASWLPLAIAFLALLSACSNPAEQPSRPQNPGTAYVIPYGQVPAAELRRAQLALADLTDRPVKLLPARPLPPETLSKHCRDKDLSTACPTPSYDASALLDQLLRGLPADTFRAVGVTTAPLDTPTHESLIGYARTGERGIVYSARAPGVYLTEAAHRRRVRHIVAHELGHTFGVGHCEKACVMADVMTVGELARTTEHPCPRHRDAFAMGRGLSIDAAGFRADVGAEQMRIGAWDPAVEALQDAVRAQPKNARHRTALGIALMSQGRLLAADDVLRDAAMQAPGAPQPYYARAVMYAAGFDPYRASAQLEAGVMRDGDPVRAHRAAGILYQDLLDRPKAAIKHFEAHIRFGGRDPEVIARLVYLLSPTTLTITDPEVIIASWDPENGLRIARAGTARPDRTHAHAH